VRAVTPLTVDLRRQLAAQLGDTPGFDLERIDPRGREHGPLVQLRSPSGLQWWTRRDGSWVPLPPEEDGALPLGALLRDVDAGSGLRVLSYRPGKRLVLACSDERGERVLKGYRPRRLALACARHEWAGEVLSRGPLRAPTLRAELDGRAALVFERHEGASPSLAAENEELFFRVGVGLRRMQEHALPAEFGVHDAAAELALLDALAASLTRLGDEPVPGWSAARGQLVPPASRDALVATHRDLHDGQLLAGDGLRLLDFDLLCAADRFLDAGNLIAHLRLRELQQLCDAGPDSVGRCGAALLDGLDRDAEPGARRRLRFYQATCFLRLALVYRLRERWARLAPTLVEQAARCLDEA